MAIIYKYAKEVAALAPLKEEGFSGNKEILKEKGGKKLENEADLIKLLQILRQKSVVVEPVQMSFIL